MTPPHALMIAGTALALLAGPGFGAPALATRTTGPGVLHVGQIDRQDVPPRGGCEPDTLAEPDVAVSPFSPWIQVAVAQDCRLSGGGAADITYAWTHDGGAHWHHAPMPGLTTAAGVWDAASDPTVAFGANGTVYVAALVLGKGPTTGIAVSKSVDGGATFAKPVIVQQPAPGHLSFDDKPWLVADTQPSSPFYGRIYLFWTELVTHGPNGGLPQLVRWSDDQGRHWSASHMLTPWNDVTQDSQPVIQPDGTLTDTYLYSGGPQAGTPVAVISRASGSSEPAAAAGDLLARTSTDGGATWGTSSRIATNVGTGPTGIRCCLPRTTGDPSTGRLYTVWEANGPGATDSVELSWSATGRHWTHPVAVTHAHNAATQYINAAVAASKGRVYVSYGIRGTARQDRNHIWQNIATSAGNDTTFSPPITLGPPSNLAYAAVSGGRFPGDYTGLSATPARLTVAWCVSSRPPNPAHAYHQTLYAAVLNTSDDHRTRE